MKNELIILFGLIGLASTSCVPDNPFFSAFANTALDLIKCQNDFLRPQTATFNFTTTYIVEDSEGKPVPMASIFREVQVKECDGSIRNLSIGFVLTNANGRFTETDNFTSNYFNDKIIISANTSFLKPRASRTYRQRVSNGNTTFTFTAQKLES